MPESIRVAQFPNTDVQIFCHYFGEYEKRIKSRGLEESVIEREFLPFDSSLLLPEHYLKIGISFFVANPKNLLYRITKLENDNSTSGEDLAATLLYQGIRDTHKIDVESQICDCPYFKSLAVRVDLLSDDGSAIIDSLYFGDLVYKARTAAGE